MLHAAPLNNPKDVAFFLASYARDARARVEGAGDLPALAAVRGALEEALGMKFEAEKGEHFFRSTLVQTFSTACSPRGFSGTRKSRSARMLSIGNPPRGRSMCR